MKKEIANLARVEKNSFFLKKKQVFVLFDKSTKTPF